MKLSDLMSVITYNQYVRIWCDAENRYLFQGDTFDFIHDVLPEFGDYFVSSVFSGIVGDDPAILVYVYNGEDAT